ncbi:MAG TPA: hypothetical protein VIO61_03065 [Anaerolineaceae bacterium]
MNSIQGKRKQFLTGADRGLRRLLFSIGMICLLVAAGCSAGAPDLPKITLPTIVLPTVQFAPPVQLPSLPTPPAYATPLPTLNSPELRALNAAGHSTCPVSVTNPLSTPRVSGAGNVWRLACVVSAGHSTEAQLEKYENNSQAHKALIEKTQNRPAQGFHNHIAVAWSEKQPAPSSLNHRWYVCQLDEYLAVIHAADDTAWLLAPDPQTVAEAIYQAGVAERLFR